MISPAAVINGCIYPVSGLRGRQFPKEYGFARTAGRQNSLDDKISDYNVTPDTIALYKLLWRHTCIYGFSYLISLISVNGRYNWYKTVLILYSINLSNQNASNITIGYGPRTPKLNNFVEKELNLWKNRWTRAAYSVAVLTDKGNEFQSIMPNNNQYREAIGALLHLSTTTRPDIATAVGILCRKVNQPRTND